jgi:DNA invertase Pin-like site-specific DNA recombinase
MSCLGYLKVSSDDGRNESRSRAVAAYAGSHSLGPVEFPESTGSGGWKPVRLDWLVEEKCQPGDSLLVPDFTAVARSMQEIHRVLSAMGGRGISLHIVDRGIVVDPRAEAAPATLSAGTAALFADFEREVMTVSMREAIKAKLEKGHKRRGPGPAQ